VAYNSHQPVLLVAPSTCIQPAARPSCQAISRFPSLWAFCTHRTCHRNHLGTKKPTAAGWDAMKTIQRISKSLFVTGSKARADHFGKNGLNHRLYTVYNIYIYIYVLENTIRISNKCLGVDQNKSSAWSIATQIANFVGSGKNYASIQVTFALLWLFHVCQFVVLTFRCYCLQRSTHYLTWVLVQRAFPQYRLGIHVPDQTP